MSTRGLYGFKRDGVEKLVYHHSDSYPEGLGKQILELLKKYKPEELNKIFDNWEMVDENTTPTKEQIEYCEEKRYQNYMVSSGKQTDWYCLTRNLQDPETAFKEALYDKIYEIDSKTFIYDSLFCEYAYIINLDDEQLEYYVGYQKVPQDDNPYGNTPNEDKYYPCKLAKTYSLKSIKRGSIEKIIAGMGKTTD